MSEETRSEAIEHLSFWDKHRFLVLIAVTIVVAVGLVAVSLVIYNMSGAAQLDLSRPGYKAVASQAQTNTAAFANYSATGPINEETIKEFQKLYDAQADSISAVDAFGGDPLNADTLEFGTTDTTTGVE